MQSILGLTFDLQAIIVVGYLGYRVSSIGMRDSHSTDDRLLQTITYGFVGLLSWLIVKGLIQIPLTESSLEIIPWVEKTVQVIIMVFTTLMAAIIWSKYLKKMTFLKLKELGVSNEDEYPTVIGSIVHGHNKMHWDYVNLYLTDGRIIQIDMKKLGGELPGNIPLVDTHGNFALYVTKIFDLDDVVNEFSPKTDEGGFKLSYYPSSKIDGMEICWREPT